MAHVLLLDAYDSFTYNVVQAFRSMGASVDVQLCDRLSLAEAREHPATHVVLSPGPGRPDDAGIMVDLVRETLGRRPLLGVCLGHQALALALGGSVIPQPPMHGRSSLIRHDGRGVFEGLPDPFEGGRYHSLGVDPATLPADLEVSAKTQQGEIMAVRHVAIPAVGLQFHPESILTPHGQKMLASFLKMGPI